MGTEASDKAPPQIRVEDVANQIARHGPAEGFRRVVTYIAKHEVKLIKPIQRRQDLFRKIHNEPQMSWKRLLLWVVGQNSLALETMETSLLQQREIWFAAACKITPVVRPGDLFDTARELAWMKFYPLRRKELSELGAHHAVLNKERTNRRGSNGLEFLHTVLRELQLDHLIDEVEDIFIQRPRYRGEPLPQREADRIIEFEKQKIRLGDYEAALLEAASYSPIDWAELNPEKHDRRSRNLPGHPMRRRSDRGGYWW